MKTTLASLRYLMFACVIIFSFIACSDDDEQGSNATIEVLSPADKQILFNSKEDEPVTITFSASNDWTAIPSHRWIDLSKRTGSAGENTIIVSVEDNDAFKKRIGTITIKDKVSGKSTDITVTQGEKDGVLIFSEENATLAIDNENQTITAEVSVKSNYDYTLNIDASWLTYEKIGRNDDGSIKYVFHADPEKLYQAGGYTEQNAAVSFEYQSEVTRAPQAKQYIVKFPGITPKIEFYIDNDGEDEIASVATLTDEFGEGIYKSMVKVKANVGWKFQEGALEYADLEIVGDDNKSKIYFETIQSISITLKDGKLDTENLNGSLIVVDANDSQKTYSLPVVVPGVGNDYVYIDRGAFPIDQAYGCFMFESGEEWVKAFQPFTVKASNMDNVKFFLTRISTPWETPSSTYYDAEWEEEASTNVSDPWSGWGGVYAHEDLSRAAVQTTIWDLGITGRSDYETGSKPGEDRYFALIAVCTDNEEFAYEDLFDAEGLLKEEYQSSYIPLGQKAKLDNFYINSNFLDTNETINVVAKGEELEIDYETNADVDMGFGVSFFTDVIWTNTEDHFDWSGKEAAFEDDRFSVDFTTSGKIKVSVAANTGTKRTIKCGLAIYIPSSSKFFMVRTFTIEQAGTEQ